MKKQLSPALQRVESMCAEAYKIIDEDIEPTKKAQCSKKLLIKGTYKKH